MAKNSGGGISLPMIALGAAAWHELACRGLDGGIYAKIFGQQPRCLLGSTLPPGGGGGSGGQCTTDTECGAGYFCSGGTCQPNPTGTCNKDADCGGAPYVCVNGTCGVQAGA